MLDENGRWEHYTITVKRLDGEKMSMDVCCESTIEDMVDVFKTILTWMTYHQDNINDIFRSEDGYGENREDNEVDESGRDDTQNTGHDNKTRSKRHNSSKQNSKEKR